MDKYIVLKSSFHKWKGETPITNNFELTNKNLYREKHLLWTFTYKIKK